MDFYLLVIAGGITAFGLMCLAVSVPLFIIYKMEKGGYFDE